MPETSDKVVWGQVEKIGKGTRASYDPDKKVLTFAFKRGPDTSSEQLRKLREQLMQELKELGYNSRMKYNGEVVADNIENEDLTLTQKNHKLVIRLNKKQPKDKEKDASEQPV